MERSSSAVKRRNPKRWASTPSPESGSAAHFSSPPLLCCLNKVPAPRWPCALTVVLRQLYFLTLESSMQDSIIKLIISLFLYFLEESQSCLSSFKIRCAKNPLVRLKGLSTFFCLRFPKVRETHRMSTIEAARQPSSRHLGSICSEM